MNIRHIFITIAAVLLTSAVLADSSSVTSKKYVDDFMADYQNKIPGSGADKLMIYDDTDGIGAKQIVSSLGDDTGATNVPNVGAVKDALDDKQDKFNGTEGYVMTGMGTNRPGEVGEKPIYGTNTNYSDALVTAEAVNTGVINAVNSSLIRVDENGYPSNTGTLWEINTNLFALSIRPLVPDGYTQLQYIESNGTQYIDTGVQNTSKLQLRMNLTAYNNDYTLVYGSQKTSSPVVRRSVLLNKNPTFISLSSGSENQTTNVASANNTFAVNVWHDATVTWSASPSLVLDNVEYTSSDTSDNAQTGLNDYLFCYNYRGTPNFKMKAKISYAKIWDSNNSMARHLVPAKQDSDGKIGMYDIVNDVFYPDAAGGNFAAGPSCISPNLVDYNETRIDSTTWATADKTKGFEVYADVYSKSVGSQLFTNPNCFGVFVPAKINESVSLNFFDYSPFYSRCYYCEVTADGKCNTAPVSFASGDAISQQTFTLTQADSIGFVFEWYISAQQTRNYTKENYMIVRGTTPPTTYRPYGENICQ